MHRHVVDVGDTRLRVGEGKLQCFDLHVHTFSGIH
ncbi:Uncharacterised protein [Mycobacterium tuberculosis]|nr:Uncharacterised protein [Mycobacterium tuberculosis]CPA13633.1 Uncharacterised protein [Mycobacterium tuberculosis]